MLISSRSFAEYRAMFDLSDRDLIGKTVIDVAAGASDFVANACNFGSRAFALDEVYRLDRSTLRSEVEASVTAGLAIIDDHPDRFTWDWYGDRGVRDRMRRVTAERFIEDRSRRPSRYLPASLPHLPLRDASVDLAVCSHLLFTWADRYDESWHRIAITELLRVAAEIRIFPTVLQGTGAQIAWLPRLIDDIHLAGWLAATVEVPYEFQLGGNRMLVINRG